MAQSRLFAGQPSGDARWNLGAIAEAGLIVAPGRGGPLFGLSYRLQRFDFLGGTAGWLDQFEMLSVWGAIHIGR